MCVWRCGVLAKVVNGKVVKLDGNPEQPHSNGKLCPRGQAGLATTYDPDRVLTPLVRVGKRGEGKFRQASWEEAIEIVAWNMPDIKAKYGPEAMVFSSTHNLSHVQFENLLQAYGSPNYGTQRSLCFNEMIVANQMTFGVEEPGRSYKDVRYILLTGRNLAEAISNSETGELIHAIDQGAKMVYIDPRFTKTAAKATEWLPIHLALTLLCIWHSSTSSSARNATTRNSSANLSVFDELAASIGQYSPEWAAEITGVSAETIRRIAQEFRTLLPRVGTQRLARQTSSTPSRPNAPSPF
jgi:thiosulfate reductase/polysulfide reductase chain A